MASLLYEIHYRIEFDFIRAEAYAYAHVADEGFLQSSAAAVTRHRRMMQATNVGIVADVRKKHRCALY